MRGEWRAHAGGTYALRRGLLTIGMGLCAGLGCAVGAEAEPDLPPPHIGGGAVGDTDAPVDGGSDAHAEGTFGADETDGGDGDDGDTADDGETGAPANPEDCGDGVVDPGEDCDDGPGNGPDGACTPECRLPACGDGFVHAATEACDDGNADDTDQCTSACAVATCGDGFVHAGVELCDDGNANDRDGCTSACTLASCGDGVTQAPEACDDGNASNTDDCLSTCLHASCGDGFVQALSEQCDDGNGVDTDGCPGTCQVASCGDGFVQAGVEPCDDGNGSDEDACVDDCQPAACGDGHVQAGVEECDGGGDPTVYSCSAACEDQLVWYQWSFNYAQTPNPMACADFTTWRAALADDHTSIFMAGTFDESGRTCTGPGATTLCNALRLGQDATVNCGGHTWHVGADCTGAVEVTADGTVCDCSANGYALRPCVNLMDWGGVGTSTCSGPGQEIYIECGFD